MKLLHFVIALAFTSPAFAAEPVFSGPQKGEKTTPFQVMELTGEKAGIERDPIAQNGGKPAVLVFIHGIERSLVPLLRAIDDYTAGQKERLATELIFLSADRLAGEERVKAAAGSLKLQSRVGISLDGQEGPGNYGLNKECLMTVVVAKDNVVTANFALVQPGFADAPKVLEAIAQACGDPNPPTAEQLHARRMAREGEGRNAPAMGRNSGAPDVRRATDLSKFDLNSEAGLRDAVRALIGEVQDLRAQLKGPRGESAPPRERANGNPPKEPFPGAVPTDEKLQGLLRSFIRPTNDDAAVDKVLASVKEHIGANADLRKQAMEGWTRVLHFEHYGTAYARKVGAAFLDELKHAHP